MSDDRTSAKEDVKTEWTVQVPRILAEELFRHARRGYPDEICGALLGEAQDSTVRVKHIHPIENQREEDEQRNRFSVSPRDYMNAEQEADRREMSLLGFYHSHPDHPAEPSDYDLEHAWPNLLYPIISVHSGEVEQLRCWKLHERHDQFRELSLTTETVSVVIPTYKRDPDRLTDAIDSFEEGTLLPDELLVVDQTPDPERREETKTCCQSYDRVNYMYLSDAGLPNARNLGWSEAEGNIVVFCDDDVIVKPEFLEAHVRNYQYSSIGGVAGRVIQSNLPDGKDNLPVGRFRHWDGGFEGNFQSTRRQDIHAAFGCNMSFRRRLLKEAGGFSRVYGGTAHLEEAEVCMKIRSLGYRMVFDPRACLRHLHVSTGGCRLQDQRKWAYWYGHNYTYFFLRHFHSSYAPLFFLERFGKALDFGVQSGDWFASVHAFLGLLDGVSCFLDRGTELLPSSRNGSENVSVETILDQSPCRHS